VRQSKFSAGHGPLPNMDHVVDFARDFAGVDLDAHPWIACFMSPLNFITKNMPPCLIQAGTDDVIVPYDDSAELASKISAVCGEDRVYFGTFLGEEHAGDAYFDEKNTNRVFKWLDGIFK
jgi:acetyl esterase/lipase